LNKQILLDNGYKEYEECHYQKCIKDGTGKRYFINIKHYNIKHPKIPKDLWRGYNCKVQFQNCEIDDKLFNNFINMDIDITNNILFSIEELLSQIWLTLGCPYYEKYEE
jgi:hypothetical protein